MQLFMAILFHVKHRDVVSAIRKLGTFQ